MSSVLWENKDEIPEKLVKLVKTVFNINPDYIRKGKEPMFLPPKIHVLTPRDVTLGMEGKGEISGGYAPGEEPEPFDNSEKLKDLRSQVADTIKKTNSHPGIKVWAYAGAGNPFNADPDESEPMEVLHIESLVSPRYRDAFRITGGDYIPI